MNREEKEKLDLLLKKKFDNDELNRCLDLYRKIDDFVEAEPTFWDKAGNAIRPPESCVNTQVLDYKRTDVPGCKLYIEITCDEVMYALRDWYRKKALELSEGLNS